MDNLDELIDKNLKAYINANNSGKIFLVQNFEGIETQELLLNEKMKLSRLMEKKGLIKLKALGWQRFELTNKGQSIMENGGWKFYIKEKQEQLRKQKEKEDLEFENKRIQTSLNKKILEDYPNVKKKAKINFWVSIGMTVFTVLSGLYAAYSTYQNSEKDKEISRLKTNHKILSKVVKEKENKINLLKDEKSKLKFEIDQYQRMIKVMEKNEKAK